MKKRHVLALLPILCLTSCGPAKLSGTYSFALGKEAPGETRIGIQMDLFDDPFTYQKNKEIKDTILSAAGLKIYDKTSLKDGDLICVLFDENHEEKITFYAYNKTTDEFVYKGTEREKETVTAGKKFTGSIELDGSFGDIPEAIQEAIAKGITGYYKETNIVDPKYGTRLDVGTVLSEQYLPGLTNIYQYIATNVSQLAADLLKTLIENSDTIISNTDIEYILTAYADGTNLTLQVPVSLYDLQQQFAWYGRYIDFDDLLMSKIVSIKDFYDNILELISTVKIFDLHEHREKITGKPVSEGDLVLMPGKEGEERFGSLPEIIEKKDGTIENQVALMNEYYASEFSNTFVYEDDGEGNMVKIGTITHCGHTKEGTPMDMYYYYDNANKVTSADANFTGFVLAKDEYDVYKDYKEVKFSFNHNFTDPNLGIQIGNVSQNVQGKDEIYAFDNFFKAPFEFRSFHKLPLALKK